MGVLTEMQLGDEETAICGYLGGLGWELAERYDERGGRKIAGICYGLFRRR